MKAVLEDISAVKKRLCVEIQSQEIAERLTRAYAALGKKAKIPGFRPGHIPRPILERRFGPQVLEEVSNDLVSETFPLALQDVQAAPIGMPFVEKDPLRPGQDFKYSVVLEVRPRFELGGYLDLEVEKETPVVTDAQVADQLELIRKSHGKMQPLPSERPVRVGDYVVLDFEAFDGDRPLTDLNSANFLLRVGSNDFHPDFEAALVGMNKGETRDIHARFDDAHYHKRLAGKEVRFRVRLTDIKEMVLPELNDDFAVGLNAEYRGLEDLKAKIKELLVATEEKRVERDMKKRLLKKICDAVAFELPAVLVEAELEYAVQGVKANLVRGGSSLEKAGLSEAALMEQFRPASELRVKEMLVLGEIASQQHIAVTDEEVDSEIGQAAAATGQDPQVLRKYYESKNAMENLKGRLLEEKVLNYLVQHAKIREVQKASAAVNEG
jgi:trigger factor